MTKDIYGREWDDYDVCPVCGQPDNCGDCNHKKLTDLEVKLINCESSEYENICELIHKVQVHAERIKTSGVVDVKALVRYYANNPEEVPPSLDRDFIADYEQEIIQYL